MNTRQITAIQNPCRFAFETVHPRFQWFDRDVSMILTVNYGYE